MALGMEKPTFTNISTSGGLVRLDGLPARRKGDRRWEMMFEIRP